MSTDNTTDKTFLVKVLIQNKITLVDIDINN